MLLPFELDPQIIHHIIYSQALLAMSGTGKAMWQIFCYEEVITLLPGSKHVSLCHFLDSCRRTGTKELNNTFTVVERKHEVPKAERIARERMSIFVHPATLSRFGCHNAQDFWDCLERILVNMQELLQNDFPEIVSSFLDYLKNIPAITDYKTLRDAFIEHTWIVSEKNLDKETRRAWIALRWCLKNYAGYCLGGKQWRNGRTTRAKFNILLGESNAADAWTDGESYIAVNIDVVKRLRLRPLQTVSYIFNLIEHEVAHEGDSLDCGHDEAFYQRFHDLSIQCSEQRQRYIYIWLRKYTYSMEKEGKRPDSHAWREQYLLERAGNGRVEKGLDDMTDNIRSDPLVTQNVDSENMAFIDLVNKQLVTSGVCPPPPDWSELLKRAAEAQKTIALEQNAETEKRLASPEWLEEMRRYEEEAIALSPSSEEIEENDRWYKQCLENEAREAEIRRIAELNRTVFDYYPEEYHQFIQPDETKWSLERNAAAAGFVSVLSYLKWRESAA